MPGEIGSINPKFRSPGFDAIMSILPTGNVLAGYPVIHIQEFLEAHSPASEHRVAYTHYDYPEFSETLWKVACLTCCASLLMTTEEYDGILRSVA